MPTVETSTEFLIREPADDYHSRSGEFLSSHLLGDYRSCPLLYHRKRCGLIPDEDRPAYLVGRAAHTVILEGKEAFRRTYAVGGPVNRRNAEVQRRRATNHACTCLSSANAVVHESGSPPTPVPDSTTRAK